MDVCGREEKIRGFFEKTDSGQMCVLSEVITQVIALEEKISELIKLPFIRVHSKNPAKQMQTEAGKQYVKLMQTYLNAVKILSAELRRAGGETEDDFDRFMKDFKP
ncbi:MAG: hypothetical protein FWG90_03635 [Oscillospiraceae bacterium]|nr:hypothetical protein [Oscillospiraceae bacterium]